MATTYFDASFTRTLFFETAEMHGNDVMCFCGRPITFTKFLLTVDPEDFKKFVVRLYFVCTNGDCPLYKDADPDPYWGGLYYTMRPDTSEDGYAAQLLAYQEKSKQLDMQLSALNSQKETFERHKKEIEGQVEIERKKMEEEYTRKYAEMDKKHEDFMVHNERYQRRLKEQEDQQSYSMSMMMKPPSDRGLMSAEEINVKVMSVDEARKTLGLPPLDGVVAGEAKPKKKPKARKSKAKSKAKKRR